MRHRHRPRDLREIRWRRDAIARLEDRNDLESVPWDEANADDDDELVDDVIDMLVDELTDDALPACPLARPWRYRETDCLAEYDDTAG